MLALSGGADSVALLMMLQEEGYTHTHALHCNFHLRGEESDRDERFCRELCQRLDIDLSVIHFDTRREAVEHHESIEMAARRLRYDWFRQKAQELHAEGIFVAHHQDDQAETVLMNLLRGTGIEGLKGMRPDSVQQGLRIVRPLLDVSKAEILQYLADHHQPFVTDSTNLERDALRNRIRLDVMPLLRQLNPQATQCIARTAENLRLSGEDSQEKELFIRLAPLGFNRTQILDISRHLGTDSSGLVWHSATHTVCIDRGKLTFANGVRHQLKKDVNLPELNIWEEATDAPDFCFGNLPDLKKPDCAYIDADSICGEFIVRRVQRGDRFQPYGMRSGSRLVSDYLTDRKVSLIDKQKQIVVADEHGIVWLVGHTIDNRCRITDKTVHIIRLNICN